MIKVYSDQKPYFFPTLYHYTEIKKISEWKISVQWIDNIPTIVTEFGYSDGKKQTAMLKIMSGKNIGRNNETSPYQQALSEARSKWEKKQLENYRQNLNDPIKMLPMLAHKYVDHKQKVNWPAYGQSKLNGCLHKASKIQTERGLLSLGDIVENKLQVSVLSYNEKTQQTEFKPIVHWFNNGQSQTSDWIELKLSTGTSIKCTLDHKVFTQRGWVKAKNLDEKADFILSSNSRFNTLLAGTILGDSILRIEPNAQSYRLQFSHANQDYFDFKVNLLKLNGRQTKGVSGYGSDMQTFISKALTKSSFPIDSFYKYTEDEERTKRRIVSYETLRDTMTLESISLWIGDDGSLRLNNNNPYTPVLQLAVMRYSEQQVEIFKQFFGMQKYQCNPTMIAFKKEESLIGYSLNFNTKDTLYLLNQLRSYHCKGVEYKYYFPTEGYIQPVANLEFSTFKKCQIRHVTNGNFTKYDIEVADNHNYFANNMLVHNCRVVAHIEDAHITYFSRKGKEYETLTHWNDELKTLFPSGTILDGEAFNPDLNFQEIVRRVKRVKTSRFNIEDDPLQYWVYDIVSPTVPYYARLAFLTERTDTQHIKIVPTTLFESEKELKRFHRQNLVDGYEGTMIRSRNGLYKPDCRSYDLLKYKDFFDEEFVIVGGRSAQGRDEGTVIFDCKTNKGQVFSVRPKGTWDERKEYLDHLSTYVGKMLTVRFQERSEDGIPIFPVGICVRDFE